MAAHKNEAQPFIRDEARIVNHRVLRAGLRIGRLRCEAIAGALLAQRIERSVLRDAIEPSRWIARHALCRPCLRGLHTRFSECLLGNVEIAEAGRERGDDPPARLPRHTLKRRLTHGTLIMVAGVAQSPAGPRSRRPW